MNSIRPRWFWLGLLVCLIEQTPARAESKALHNAPHWREPIALAAIGPRIYVANQRSGTISILDAGNLRVLSEVPLGQRLADLALIENGQALAIIDEAAHQLLRVEPRDGGLHVAQRLDVSRFPVSVAVDSSGTRLAVASLWSRRVTLVRSVSSADPSTILQTRAVIDLPFSPRKLIWLDRDRRLLAADSFGGRLAVINPETARLLFVKSMAGQNVRGLAVSRDGQDLLLSQQVLSSTSKTLRDNVFWGDLLQNVLRSQALDELLSPEPTAEETGDLFRTEPLGHPSDATGDPYAVRVLPGGQTAVALSGVGEIAIRRTDQQPFERFEAGQRPTALLPLADGNRLLVANTFSDSLTIFDLKKWAITGHVSLGPTDSLSERDQGERLFYDARVSLDGWYSCHSCHTDGQSTGHRNDNFGDLSFGAPKRILPLGGVGETGPWAWNAQSKTMASQIHVSIRQTMQGKVLPEKDVKALETYLNSLKPAPALDRARGTLDQAAVLRGQQVFNRQGCAACHQPPTYTSPETYDVGLMDEVGQREFNPPSLRGVSQRQRFFHDNRADSLSEVLQKFRHPDGHKLNDQELADLLAFLGSL